MGAGVLGFGVEGVGLTDGGLGFKVCEGAFRTYGASRASSTDSNFYRAQKASVEGIGFRPLKPSTGFRV